MKKCTECKKEKMISEFHKNSAQKDGHHFQCKDCRIKYQKKYRNNNKEKILKTNMEYKRKNIEKYRSYKYKRKSAKYYKVLDKELKKLYSDFCVFCGSLENQTIDHIIPLSRGGNHCIGNLQTLCHSCNSKKGKKLNIEFKNTPL